MNKTKDYIKEHYDEFECCNCNNLYDCLDQKIISNENKIACAAIDPTDDIIEEVYNVRS